MEGMDIDDTLIDIPDTPDRLSHWTISCGGGVENGHDLLVVGHSENPKCLDEKFVTKAVDNDRVIVDNRYRKRLISSKITHIVGHPDNSSFHKSASSSVSMDDHFLGASIGLLPQEVKEISLETGGASIDLLPQEVKDISLETGGCSSDMSNRNCKVLEKTSSYPFNVSTLGKDREKDIIIPCKSQHEEGNSFIEHAHQVPLPRVPGQKRLVKNGCCLSTNIGKANQFGAFGSDVSKDVECNETSGFESSCPPCHIDVSDVISQHRVIDGKNCLPDYGLISPRNIPKPKQIVQRLRKCSKGIELNETKNIDLNAPPVCDNSASKNQRINDKGKAVISQPCTSAKCRIITKGLPSRTQRIHKEGVEVTSDNSRGGISDGLGVLLGGWRSTRIRSKKTHIPASDETKVHSGFNDNNFAKQGANQAKVDAISSSISESNQGRGQHHSKYAHIKRQRKQGSVSCQPGECSTSVLNDSEVVFLDSSGESPNLRSRRHQNCHQIIEIQESPSEGRQKINSSRNDDISHVRAKQVEADAILARELQEQLYHETPVLCGDHELDTNIAWALQQEENAQQASLVEFQHTLLDVDAQQASSSGRRRNIVPNESLNSRLYRSQFRPNQARRGNRAHLPTSNRRRSRNQPPETAVPLPELMELERRVNMLEAFEASATDYGTRLRATNLAGVQRDFNESDYEMLLALDENNNERRGASVRQINSLPQSTLKNDNSSDEACAICLETPTMGNTIRHLPCLHKFHKDCIDPWLRRRSSCPVCKSFIT